MGGLEIDLTEYKAFFARMRQAGRGGFKQELELFLQEQGTEFLRIVEDEIVRLKAIDTRLLLASFEFGGPNPEERISVWSVEDGGLALEVGTNVEYAAFVNDGHWRIGEDMKGALRYKKDTKNGRHKAGELKRFSGEIARFVPGTWKGDRFTYDKKADTGMVLRQRWVEGKQYWENAINIIEKMFPQMLDARIQEWLNAYFAAVD